MLHVYYVMLYYIILYFIILHYITVYYIILYYIMLLGDYLLFTLCVFVQDFRLYNSVPTSMFRITR